jgi:hypothetical protein
MSTTRASRRIELAHRASDGLDVYLYWNRPASRVTVRVVDARRADAFEFEVDGAHALQAFHHPYVYAGGRHVALEREVPSPHERAAGAVRRT